MEKSKKITVFLFLVFAALVLCLGMTFGMSSNASAANTTTTVEVASYEELVSACNTASADATDHTTIKLTQDITLTADLVISKNITLDLGGNVITENGGNITINGTKIDASVINGSIIYEETSNSAAIYVNAAKTATISDVKVDSNPTGKNTYGIYIDKNSKATTKIVDCDIKAKTSGVYNCSTGKVEIYGAEVATYEELVNAYNSASNEATIHTAIKLTQDITLNANLTISKNIILDLGGNVITENGGYIMINGAKINASVINGSIIYKSSGSLTSFYPIYVNAATTATIDSVTIDSDPTGQNKYGIYIAKNCTGTTNITDCNIKATTSCVYNCSSGRVVITGTSEKVNALETTETTETKKCIFTTKGQAVYINGSGATLIDNCALISTWTYCVSLPAGNTNLTKIVNSCLKSDYVGVQDKSMGELKIDNCVIIGGDDKNGYGVFINKTNPLDNEKTAPVSILNSKITTVKASGIAYFNLTGKFTVENCKINAPSTVNGITGNGGYHGSDVLVKDTFIEAGTGIYSPEDGELVVDGGEIKVKPGGASGIEIRAGKLTVKNNTKITVPPEIQYSCNHDASGGAMTGAAIAVAQHTTNKPIDVNIESATLSADRSLAQDDPETATDRQPVTIHVSGGSFTGEVQTSRVDHFIGGGEFDVQPDPTYLVDHTVAYEEPNHKYLVAAEDTLPIILEANDYVMFYAAAWNVKYTEEISSIIYGNTDTTAAGIEKAKQQAIAKVNEIRDLFVQVKKDAIAEITAAAAEQAATETTEAQAAVVVPTATIAAINAAVDEEQVEAFKLNALDEIDDIRNYRKQIKELGDNGNKILEAIAAFRNSLLGDETTAGKLADSEKAIKDYLDTIKKDINDYTSSELDTLKGELDTSIGNAVTELKSALATEIAKVEKTVDGIAEAFGIVFDDSTDPRVSSELEALKTALADLKTDSTAIIGKLDAMDIAALDEKLDTVKTDLGTVKTDISALVSDAKTQLNAKLETLTADVGALTGRLNEVNSGLLAELEAIGGQVADLGSVTTDNLAEKLTEVKTAVDSISFKVSSATGVEEAKKKAIATIKETLDDLFGESSGAVNGSKEEGDENPDCRLTPEQRAELHKVYSDDMAVVVERYYNEALTAVENGTTVAEVRAAAINFKRDVETATLIDGIEVEEGVSLFSVYIMLAVALAFSAGALVSALVSLFKKK